MVRFLGRLMVAEDGPTSVEYAVMLALLIGVMIAGIKAAGLGNGGLWSYNASTLPTAP